MMLWRRDGNKVEVVRRETRLDCQSRSKAIQCNSNSSRIDLKNEWNSKQYRSTLSPSIRSRGQVKVNSSIRGITIPFSFSSSCLFSLNNPNDIIRTRFSLQRGSGCCSHLLIVLLKVPTWHSNRNPTLETESNKAESSPYVCISINYYIILYF